MTIPQSSRIINTDFLRTGFGDEDITEQEYTEAEIQYDENGRILTEKHFNSDGNLESAVENEYDAQGRVVSSAQYDETGELCQRNVFTYGEDDKVLKKSCFYGEGSPEYATVYVYENGLLMREDSYNEDEFDYTEKSYEYDKQGRVMVMVEYDEEGKVMYRTTNEYDENGRLAQRLREEPQEHDSRTYVYAYDEEGRRTKELTYNYGGKLIAKTYYTYDEEGRLVEQEDENLDTYRRTASEYEGDLCMKVTLYDKEGEKMGWTEYEYDETGNVALLKNYVRDEVRPDFHRSASWIKYETEWR